MKYFLYIIHSLSKDKYYIGQTNDLTRRLNEHNQGISFYTKSGIPWKLVFSKEFNTRFEAMQLERRLKSMKNKKYLKWLIENNSKVGGSPD